MRASLTAVAACCAALLPSLYADDARSVEFLGMKFGAHSANTDGERVPYTVTFEVPGAARSLRKTLESVSTLHAERNEPPMSEAALLARARGDYARLLAALYAEAHYGGSVAITLAGRRVEDIAADTPLPRPAEIRIAVVAGPVFSFGSIAIDGAPPADERIDTPADLGLVQGAPAKSGIVLKAERAIVAAWRAAGYPKATVERKLTANHAAGTIDVALFVTTGPQARYGEVRVRGAERTDAAFVAREAGIERGRNFSSHDIDRARDEMRRLEVFSSTRVVEGEVGPDGEIPIEIDVAERKPRTLGVGATYSTVDGAAVQGYWQHRNLFGRAEQLKIEGRVGGIESADFGEFDYLLGATFIKPGVFTPRTAFTNQFTLKREELDTYDEESITERAGLVHRFSPMLTGQSFVSIEASRIEDALGERDFLFTSLPTDLIYDGRDDRFDPTRGFTLAGTAEPFHESEFGNSGLISQAKGSYYRAIGGSDRLVLAGKLAIGSIAGAPRDELPATRLFFAGGGGSVRGYAYRSIGPRLDTGEIVGGRSYFAGSFETRVKVTETVGLVPFVDFGSAYASELPDFSEELRVGAGLGLRYYTGIGPLRLDVAFPVNPRKEDPDVAVYIGIGQEF